MFDRQTVIVLGAGASADFGFPLGDVVEMEYTGGHGGWATMSCPGIIVS